MSLITNTPSSNRHKIRTKRRALPTFKTKNKCLNSRFYIIILQKGKTHPRSKFLLDIRQKYSFCLDINK